MTRLLRYFGCVLLGAILGAAGAFLFHWLRVRGTKVVVPFRQPSAVVLSTSPQEMRLWPGKVPGSENWTQQETDSNVDGEHRVYNVVDPTLTAYFPPAGSANGTSIIVCPGGGDRSLSIDSEGVNVARFLNSLGIAAFLLRYRLAKTDTGFFPAAHNIQIPGGDQPVIDKMTPLITADGQQAVRIIRSHATQWGLDPHRIGVIGFSSGGYLALSLAAHDDADSLPDFAAPIYAVPPAVLNAKPDPIPMFLACADDDAEADCIRAYNLWHSAGVPVELHVFVKGGHGFGMHKQNLPSDAWPELFEHWLQAQGYLHPPAAK
ncbi:Esterase (fragment) [Candidatus Sulfotelmatomonas gaucii]|uniref:Esterase n=1 Tax=Candidatus Sulfuritelmatomonas gaucii TaxID=2043161 RepID=A0A2N9M9Y0_9BACT